MDTDREKFVDISIIVIIAAVGLFTAFLTFGILDSQASAKNPQYSVGGAIAGALISWGVLGSLYRQFRQSSDTLRQLKVTNAKLQETIERGDQLKELQGTNAKLQELLRRGDDVKELQEANAKLQELLQRGDELKELRKRNEELQQKLIKGAPRPHEYEIEISDREKIVLARPSKWLPRGGTIFEFELPASAMHKDDVFPAQFRVSYIHIDKTTGSADEYYRDFELNYSNPDYYAGHTSEYIELGGEPFGIRSLKLIIPVYCRIEVYEARKTKKPKFAWNLVTLQEYNEATKPPPPGAATAAPTEPNTASTVEALKETTTDSTPVTDATAQTGNPTDGATTSSPTSNDSDPSATTNSKFFYDRLTYMVVACYHDSLDTIYWFEFWDDLNNFTQMSANFNQILRSMRFLT